MKEVVVYHDTERKNLKKILVEGLKAPKSLEAWMGHKKIHYIAEKAIDEIADKLNIPKEVRRYNVIFAYPFKEKPFWIDAYQRDDWVTLKIKVDPKKCYVADAEEITAAKTRFFGEDPAWKAFAKSYWENLITLEEFLKMNKEEQEKRYTEPEVLIPYGVPPENIIGIIGGNLEENPVDWRWLLENWDKLPPTEKEKIRTLLKTTPTEKALKLLKEHPELEKLYRLAGIEPPKEIIPIKPPEVKPPPPKVLPPIPETCPICGSPLEQVEKVPLRVKDRKLLSAEEEYIRAKLGLPIPEEKIEMIPVPPTMKIWVCREGHIFERDAYGRLIERTPEYIYRKILREKAKLEKIVYPPPPKIHVPTRPEIPPTIPTVRPPTPAETLDLFHWLAVYKGITDWKEYAKLPDYEREKLRAEFLEWVRKTLKRE